MKRKLIIPLVLILSLGTATLSYAAEADAVSEATSGASAAAEPAKEEPKKETPAPAVKTETKATTTPKATTPNKTTTPAAPAAPAPSKTVSTVVGTESYNEQGQLLYTVVKGDCLWNIAKKYNTTYKKIASLNNIANPDRIYVGQVFIIPDIVKPAEEAKPFVVVPFEPVPFEPAPVEPTPVVTTPVVTTPVVTTPVEEVKPVDAVTSASPKETSDPAAIKTGLSANGGWILSILSDVEVPGLAVAGVFHDKDDPEAKIYRKLALYAQDENRNVTANYTMKVGTMYVTSPNFRIQNGKVIGDIYVNADGFELNGTTVEGNVYFETQEQLLSAKQSNATVTGVIAVKNSVDATTAVSEKETSDPAAIKTGLSANGGWILSVLSDVTVDGLTVAGKFNDKDNPESKVYRKLALYSQDSNHIVTDNYTLTVGPMYVTSPNFRIQNGTVVGDIYVNADGFELSGTTLEGNLYFETEAQMLSAKQTNAVVTGEIAVKNSVDATTGVSAKETSVPAEVAAMLSEQGEWILSVLSDVKIDGELVVAGDFHSNGNPESALYRKLALYSQGSGRTVTDNYTLTVEKMTVTSTNFRIQNGKVVGDIYVNADGFELYDCVVEGNVYFATAAQMESAKLERGTVTGTIAVK